MDATEAVIHREVVLRQGFKLPMLYTLILGVHPYPGRFDEIDTIVSVSIVQNVAIASCSSVILRLTPGDVAL
jgi:hypothetical protein